MTTPPKPTHATPRPKPTATPVDIKDAARKRRERELDARIEALRPSMERAEAYLRAQGVDLAAMYCSPKALSVWNSQVAAAVHSVPRRVIF